MGCGESKTKTTKAADASPNSEAAEFLSLANRQGHPVAVKLLQEWKAFVDAQAKKAAGDPSAAEAYAARPHEMWADTENSPVSHQSVDDVGRKFLEYIKSDLSQRGWGGNFDYKVAGVPKQGFLKANANVDTGASDEPQEVAWEVKIHYHSVGADK